MVSRNERLQIIVKDVLSKCRFCLIPVVFHEIRGQCCPEGAWGELNNADYQTLGQIDKVLIKN